MTIKRSIPKVAAAALTLGGGAAASGCSSDSSTVALTDVEAFCDLQTSCYGETNAYFNRCVDRYYDNVLYYYDAGCRSIIRDMLGCLGDYLYCSELSVNDFSVCGQEVDDAYYDCDFDFYYYH
ncbi:MAG: hypothetical protein ACOCXM_11005 [Myxococcota bacterium]